MRGSRRGTEVPRPLENHKAQCRAIHRPVSKTPFKWPFRWRAEDGPLSMVYGLSHLSSTKKMSELGPL